MYEACLERAPALLPCTRSPGPGVTPPHLCGSRWSSVDSSMYHASTVTFSGLSGCREAQRSVGWQRRRQEGQAGRVLLNRPHAPHRRSHRRRAKYFQHRPATWRCLHTQPSEGPLAGRLQGVHAKEGDRSAERGPSAAWLQHGTADGVANKPSGASKGAWLECQASASVAAALGQVPPVQPSSMWPRYWCSSPGCAGPVRGAAPPP